MLGMSEPLETRHGLPYLSKTITGPASVFITIHETYEDHEVRSVHASEEGAKADLVTRTPSGRRSSAYGAHDELCCRIEEFEVQA